MPFLSQKRPLSRPLPRRLLAAVLLTLTLAAASTACLVLKRDGLQFHTRDYNYFIEQAAKLTDPGLTKRYALNIDGFNFLGLQGIEGGKSLNQAIHTDYFRYSYAALYGLFQSTLVIYVFYSLIFFSPILYLGVIIQQQRLHWKLLAYFAALYALFPATLFAVTSDLRSRMLFSAAWALLAMAVYFRRSFVEKLVCFCLLVSIREEGIILSAILAAINLLWMWGRPGAWKQLIGFLAIDAAAFAAFLAFMRWGGYTRIDPVTDPRVYILDMVSSNLALILLAALIVLGLAAYVWFRKRQRLLSLFVLLAYGGAVAITGVQSLRDARQWLALQPAPVSPLAAYLHIVTEPATALVYYLLILLLILLWDCAAGTVRRVLEAGLLAFALLFAGTTLATAPAAIAGWAQSQPAAQLVWDFKASHDRYHTNVLLDYSTYQAFYDYERVLVYNRLPLWLVYPQDRFYPQNKDILAQQVKQRRGYAIVSRASLPDIEKIANQAGVSASLVESNTVFAVIEFR